MCRAGYYGDSLGMSSDTCTGKCPAGYHCPVGTSSSTSRPCTDAATYVEESIILKGFNGILFSDSVGGVKYVH